MVAKIPELRPSRFHGGLTLDEHKTESTRHSIQPIEIPPYLTLPMRQHIGQELEPVVNVGDRVMRGQKLASAPDGGLSAPIHAPTSGVIYAIEDRPVPHVSGLKAPCIVIRTDGNDTRFQPPLCPDPLEREPGVVAGCIHAGGVVGLGGAVFPTYAKITADSHGPINTLIINAAECEPYITCDDMLMRERAEEIVDGMRILVHALKAKRAILGIEDNKQDALASITAVMERMQCDQVAVSTVPTLYPSGGERQLIKLVTGQEVPPNGLPLDIGIACFNVSTAAAVHRALRHSHPLTHRIVTVTGGGVERPGNYEVPIGTPISHLIEQAGGYKPDARRLIMGGPMMGFALPDDDLPIVKATNCLIVATEGETATPEPAQPCIRCGYCARDCPMNLLPQQLYWHTHARDFELVEKHHIFSCIECGICSYVCPSHIPLVDYFRFAKHEIRNERRKRDLADRARIRVEARTARLEREQAERDAKRAAKKKALNKKPPVKIPADKKAVDPQPPGDKQTMDKPAKVAKSED